MPKHDPDGEVVALALTIPSWKESIDRVRSVADLQATSESAKDRARMALHELVAAAQGLLASINHSVPGRA